MRPFHVMLLSLCTVQHGTEVASLSVDITDVIFLQMKVAREHAQFMPPIPSPKNSQLTPSHSPTIHAVDWPYLYQIAPTSQWTPGQTPPPNDPNPFQCGTASLAHCIEGCNYSHGYPPAPLPPPCVPDGWTCPVSDPPFDMTRVQLSGTFGNGMVLQRSPAQAAAYGTATPGASITVTLTNPASGFTWRSDPTAVSMDADPAQRGTWKVILPPRPYGEGYTLSASCSGCTNASAVAEIADVLFGEVWLCR